MELQGRNLKVNMRGDDVRLLQEELSVLGFVNEDVEGFFGQNTVKAVKDFQSFHGFRITGVVDSETAKRINIEIEGIEQRCFIVNGEVRESDGSPFVGGLIRAYDQDMRSLELLGEVNTDESGHYAIQYTSEQFQRAEKENADLLVRAFNKDGRALASSSIVFNAKPVETVNLFIGPNAFGTPSEFERYEADLRPLMQEVPFSELKEDDDHEDITFLSGETGIDPLHITYLSIAFTLAAKTNLSPEVFYGFFREGLPTELYALVTENSEIKREALLSALRQNIIPSRLKDDVDKILEALHTLDFDYPVFLIQPEILFSSVSNLKNLPSPETNLITKKLNDKLHCEILTRIKTENQELIRKVRGIVLRIDYRQFENAELSTLIKENILSQFKTDKRLAAELREVEKRLSQTSSPKVKDLLQLNVPLKESPIFNFEITRSRTLEYSRMAQLDNRSAVKLMQKDISLDDVDESVLDGLVSEGILNDQQKKDLEFIITLGKLSDGNLSFIDALKKKGFKSLHDLITWEKEDWIKLINDETKLLPPGETPETYTENILFNLELTYPSHFLLNRLKNSEGLSRLQLLESVNSLLEHNDSLFNGDQSTEIDWGDLSIENRDSLKANLEKLSAFAKTYRYLEIPELINSKNLSLEEKKSTIRDRLGILDAFYQRNPNLDLLIVNFFPINGGSLNWDSISAADQSRIRKQLMAYQRILLLADETVDRQMLLNKGYDSATRIADTTLQEFVESSGLPLGKAQITYAKAQQYALSASHNYAALQDTVWGKFNELAVSNLLPKLINDLREIDGFDDLFGPQDFCNCEECSSILSPAAYFVDLMYFVEKNVSKPVFIKPKKTKHPLYLKNRRSDLWKLKLTCENTHTLIPYLTIVNEVLENYIETFIAGDIFEKLSHAAEKISFALPFNLPLEELRLYLSHFGTALHDIYRTLKQNDDKILRARLNLSKEEFDVIAIPDIAGVKFRFGNPASFADFDLQNFIRLARINRKQLDELLALTFIPDLKNIKVSKKSIPDELQNFPEILKNLSIIRLDVIHRFIHLWKKTPWSIGELDLILSVLKEAALIGDQLNSGVILILAKLVDIQEKLKLTPEELCAMVNEMPVSKAFPKPPAKKAEKRLYERLFDLKKLFGEKDPVSHEVNTTAPFHHYSLNTLNPNDQQIDPKTPILLGGLGISETELLLLFDLLKDEMPFDTSGDTTLDRKRISFLYRHARLAKSLKLTVEDFIQAVHLNFDPLHLVITSLEQIYQLKQFRDWQKSSPFSVSELRFILRAEESSAVKYKTNVETVATLIQSVQASTDADKMVVLKTELLKLFNVTSNHLNNILKWISVDLNDSGIQVALNASFTDGTPDNPDELNPLLDLLKQIERVQSIFANLKFKEDTVAYLTVNPAGVGIIDLKNLTLENLKALTFYKRYITLKEEGEPFVQSIMNSYLGAASFSANDKASLATLWQVDQSLVESLTNSLVLSPVPIDALPYFTECLTICRMFGINGYSLNKLAEDSDFSKVTAARDVALGAFSSKYEDENTRQEKLEPYQDKINVIKRDALTDYIIAREKDLKFKDLQDIYAFFLLDVEMSGCFRTSRVVCAISSLQLYIHRCLVNLEQSDPKLNPNISDIHVDPALIPQEEWDWRKNYRVWEANRKVFLYPENYIEPYLLDIKTPILKELEDELLQEKITKESAEAAYKKYLSRFDELARLEIAGTYYHEKTKTYYFFAHSQQDPPEYFYRKWINGSVWTAWEKIDIGINSDHVSAVIYAGKLFLFWCEIKETSKTKVSDGGSSETNLKHKDLVYTFLMEQNHWIPTQKLRLGSWLEPIGYLGEYDENLAYAMLVDPNNPNTTLLSGKSAFKNINKIIFPVVTKNNEIVIFGYDWDYTQFDYATNTNQNVSSLYSWKLNLFENKMTDSNIPGGLEIIPAHARMLKLKHFGENAGLRLYQTPKTFHEAEQEVHLEDNSIIPVPLVTNFFSQDQFNADLDLVSHRPGDFIFKLGDQQYLIYRPHPIGEGLLKDIVSLLVKRVSRRITTSLANELGQILFSQQLDGLFSLNTQKLTEQPVGIKFTNSKELLGPWDNPKHVDFKGSYGIYYREIFFHIPFLIASHLNANQKFEEAKWWYERIFNPTASESPDDTKPTDRNWRYIEFRDITIQKLKEILSDDAAIDQYKKDPFNPHAIARLRLSAYQKAIVMKYIDNLLDWGDYLFGLDTMESINEATMLYILAADILGRRPVELGKCETINEELISYEKIGPAIEKGSEFLIVLENWSYVNSVLVAYGKYKQAEKMYSKISELSELGSALSGTVMHSVAAPLNEELSLDGLQRKYEVAPYNEILQTKGKYDRAVNESAVKGVIAYPGLSTVKQSKLVFCIPPNYNLLKYWDRVEDRLYKIRHCMNISGIRRKLALFQPPLEPMDLVRGRAAGLGLEEILAALVAPLPPYRFSYLIEKARQFTQTVQNFGNALLSAMEKKDVEELTLLRSVHEQHILRMTREIKKQQIREAQFQYQAMVETKTNVENKITHYQDLIDGGLTFWEVTEQISKHIGASLLAGETAMRLSAGISFLIPQVGSPFAMKYGGKETGDSQMAFSEHVANLAKISEAISGSAGLEASFTRREEEWRHLLLLAQQELKQVDQQLLASEAHQLIAEKDLEIHEKNMEQADELHEFYKNKFTSLGLANYLSTTLNRLYREAYNVAFDLAKMAEQTYQFERDDEAIFIENDNWEFDRAGLLAGERLLMQLQQLEKAYLEQNTRDYEVTQSFSLALLDPSRLILLRQNGVCEFTIPEIGYDLFYPGQYKRVIKSVRVTVPCVAGPYTNIGAKLTLKESKVRKLPSTDSGDLIDIPNQKLTSVAFSNAINDGGLFELNFRDERYLPFEGAGAISTWSLELPTQIRSFDYNTISDVILHISYTAKDDGAFKETVENQIVDSLTEFGSTVGLYRLLSIRHEFPNSFQQLLNPSGTLQTTSFELTKQHFPYFLANRELALTELKVYLRPKGEDPIDTSGLTLKINNSTISNWANFGMNLKESTLLASGTPIKGWTINAGEEGLDKEELADLFLLIKYTIVQ